MKMEQQFILPYCAQCDLMATETKACMEMLCSLGEQFFGGTVNLKKAASRPGGICKDHLLKMVKMSLFLPKAQQTILQKK